MRIIHFSDIHLSYKNYNYFITVFRKALIDDLKSQLSKGTIDLIIISGDLVDKGGFSLFKIREYIGRENEITPFHIFEEIFIDPISKELSIPKNNFVFVAGNHDVDETNIFLKEESDLINKIIECNHNIHEIIEANESNFEYSKRIECFKKFEKQYHLTNNEYECTKNQSTFIYHSEDGVKYGFILLNDAWRCKSIRLLIEEQNSFNLNLGSKQIYDGLEVLKGHSPDVVVCVMHHPLEKFNDREEIRGIFITEDIDLVLYGDLHATKFEIPQTITGGYISSQCKALNSIQHERDIEYLSGYQILEINKTSLSSISYRFFDGRPEKKRFFPDSTMSNDGTGINRNDNGLGYPFFRKRKIDFNNENNFRN